MTLAFATSARADVSDYGIKSFSASLSTNQAGDHPDFVTSFDLKREPSGLLHATTREIVIDSPPGLTGNPNVVPKCTAAQLVLTDVNDPSGEGSCPIGSQVGISEVTVFNEGGARTFIEPVYNMEPPGDEAVARLGLIAEVFPTFIDIRVRSEGDYGLRATIEGAGSLIPLLAATTTLWGVPAASSHDPLRITPYEALHCGGEPCTSPGGAPRDSGLIPAPFLTNPTRCGAPLEIGMIARSYALPDQPSTAIASLPAMAGCGKLDFDPTLTVTPSSGEAAAPTGLDVRLALPQDENAGSIATSQLRYARVVLPQGMTIAPGAADGLAACSAVEVGLGTSGPASCPSASKIATVEIDSPSLARVIDGAVFQRTPVKGNLFGVWLVSDELGLHLKLPGEVEADPVTGQLSTSFTGTAESEGLPQEPVREFRLHFKSGPRAPLAAPQSCGAYLTHYEFTPWSGRSPVAGATPMSFDRGCETGGFSPELSAGTANPVAGAFAAFTMTLTRESREQNISALALSPPRGLSAKLAGVTLCEGVAAETGSCPPASRVGIGRVATGPGAAPLWLPQPGKDPILAYLSGPYKGAPYSFVVKAPAQAGPFDFGTVVTRAAIRINPTTARATVASDPLPQILEGVPVTYRTIHVELDRRRFALNPTSCTEMQVDSKVASVTGQLATPRSRFQVGGCRDLGFRPTLSLRLFGKTNRGAHPRLRAVLRPRKGDANIASAQVALPRSEFLDQEHIRTVCTRVQFAQDGCPKGSIYGFAKATTPLLDEPLRGPVYLRSSNNTLPDLVIALGGSIEIDAVGRIDSIKGGGIRTTFAVVPDAPLTRLVLTMQGGGKGLLVNSRNLCKGAGRVEVELDAHNGRSIDRNPTLQNDCAQKRRRNTQKKP
ncbi:MAG TPA: hypothetical protein VNO20_02090 [Solirubrobacterales bacterium]|nr:hypothetical protein [Solirubrobacterales bacterium]